MGGPGSGNRSGKSRGKPKGSVSNPMYTKEGDNARILKNSMLAWERPRVDTKSPEAVERAIYDYFQHCIDTDTKPGVMAMAAWLGVDHFTVARWYQGVSNKPLQPIIIKAYGVLKQNWEQYMEEGLINPIVGIFQGKAFYGLKDTQEIVINTAADTPRLTTDDLLTQARLLPGADDGTVIDVDVIEDNPKDPED